MNLILLERGDFVAPGRVRLVGRRRRHASEVLKVGIGDSVRVGVLDGELGIGTVVSLDANTLELEVSVDRPAPRPHPCTVVLALPRPKVLKRLLADLASLGVERIVLLETWRVEKSYWQSPALEPAALRRALRLGLEQAMATQEPEVLVRRRFKPFVEDELDALAGEGHRLVAHPSGGKPCPGEVAGRLTLVVGPEGGLTSYEVERLEEIGFAPVRFGPRILRVETAVAALLGRLLPVER